MTSTTATNNDAIKALFKLDPTIESFRDEAYNSQLVQDVWRDKYLQKGETKPEHSYRRVARAIAGAPCEKDPVTAEALFFEMMNNRLFLPGGRILAGAGTDKVVTLMNCLGGETELYTKEFGVKTLQELAGKTVTVLTRSGWKSAKIKCFGIQKLNRIELAPSRSKNRRKVVRATATHRWFLKGGMEITKLHKGAKLETCSAFISGNRDEYRAGLFHGIIFGDGQLHRQTLREVSGGYPQGTYHHVLRACGRVTEHYDLLDEYCTNYKQPDAAKGDRIYYHHGSENYKDFPVDKSADYINGFIDGWWIADGHYENGQTQRCISSTSYEHLDWLVKYAPLGGYIVTGDKIIGKKVTNLGVAKDPCRAVTILPEEKTGGWEVISIQEDAVEPVYCAVVDDVHAFCLTEGLYTGNCYVNETLEDSMEGIFRGVTALALTSQQGGGMGTAFETLRPANAILKRTQSAASGVLPFMDVYSQTGKTIRSAGERRAAQMGTISDTHPDLPEYIVAKGNGLKDGSKRLSEFNISVLISDAFLAACEDDEQWLLYFHIPPTHRDESLAQYDFTDGNDVLQYVYGAWRARDLWDLILRNTYEYSDPGIIFIDRVNDLNNLQYCETIRCTNPCGEQPLPPNGTCNLGAINVAQCVRNPFTQDAELDLGLIEAAATAGVRFLDNVIEVTGYPLEAQRDEEYAKRRIGLGITGLGTCLAQLRQRYGSVASERTTTQIMKTIAMAAYRASVDLAKSRGSFPKMDACIIEAGFINERIPDDIQELIVEIGLRNGVILTIAPVGTGSIALGNISSGLEPDFAHAYERNVRSKNTEVFTKYTEKSYTLRFLEFIIRKPADLSSDWLTTALDLDIAEHIRIQGACQKWVDASVSKTVNIPEDYPFDKFAEVYQLAYQYGCKGCTTYRPSGLRENILQVASDPKVTLAEARKKRGEELSGTTYKIKWPSLSSSLFVTVNYMDEKPYEIFFASKDAKFQDWMTSLTLLASALLRNNVDPAVIPRELRQVKSTHDTGWHNGKAYGSLVARIAKTIEDDFIKHGIIPAPDLPGETVAALESRSDVSYKPTGEICPSCSEPHVVMKESCKTCNNCGWSECG